MSTGKGDAWGDICPPVTGAAAGQRGALQHHGQSRSARLQTRFPKENVDSPPLKTRAANGVNGLM